MSVQVSSAAPTPLNSDSNPEMDSEWQGPLLIRRYHAADHDAVWDLHNLALLAVDAHLAVNGPWDEDLHHIEEVYLARRGEFLVGLVDGRIVAMGALRQIDERWGQVKRARQLHWFTFDKIE